MRSNRLVILVMLVLLPASWVMGEPAEESGATAGKVGALIGQDLHLAGRELISHQPSTGEYTLVFKDRFSMSIGANEFHSDSAAVWLRSVTTEYGGRARVDYKATVYLEGNLSIRKGQVARSSGLSEAIIEKGQSMVVRFGVGGEVFVTADKREEITGACKLELCKRALAAFERTAEPKFVIQAEARVPEWPPKKIPPKKPPEERVVAKPLPEKPVKVKPPVRVPRPEEKKPSFMYPVNIAPAGEASLDFESTKADDGTDIMTVIGRLYVSQKQDEKGGLLELQADSAVIYSFGEQSRPEEGSESAGPPEDLSGDGRVRAIYLSGDVVMTEGQRTIRADEMYYDFIEKKALAINGEMRSFDIERGIPIYVRGAKLRQLAENRFAIENATLTSSEFYQPQISFNASSAVITDTTPVDERNNKLSDSSYDVRMHDARLKMYDKTIFYWPYVRSNLQRSDIPLKSGHTGHDRDWGMLVETRWYLSRLLGLREPEGVDSTLSLDYYSKRGVGVGADIDYAREDYFGRLLGYIIRDTGDDDLGRHRSRKNIKPPRELRGRLRWLHRHFLPYNWQLTTEVSYISDQHFIEGYYRGEFYVGKEQETLVHLKRIEDNRSLSILGKVRINDFVDTLEELPTIEYHVTGQSLFDDRFTFYSDSQLSRFRERSDSRRATNEYFTFMSERAELDMPLTVGRAKVVPFVAGTLGYEDGKGFRTNIDGSTETGENNILFGEAGARVSLQPYWKVYPNVKSRLWDLNQLRHIVRPHLTVVGYAHSDSVAEQRDILNVGISQRLQTKRGVGSKQRTVDWMRLDMDVTWMDDSDDTSAGPDRFIWNRSFVPLADTLSGGVPPQDRRSSQIFGPRRNYFGADYLWRLSDTTAILSDLNFDLQSSVVQQFNIGFSHLRWPNLSYYIGSRYLRRIDNGLGQKGSNAFTFAATYVLDPRYTLVFSQQFDFDYGANVRSDITLIRRYHRIYYGLTFSADESRDRQGVVFSIWPQGVPELAIGPRRYMELGQSRAY